MVRDPLIFAAISDLAGKMRGKAFPASKLEKRLRSGIGWVPTNALITCFDTIALSPFGALGDLALMPDLETLVEVDFKDGGPQERFMLSDITTTESAPWSCCTRSILKTALARLKDCARVTLNAAFEHEFQIANGAGTPGTAFSLEAFCDHLEMGETLMGVLDAAGLKTDTFLKEYGADQFEVTVEPQPGLIAADQAAILRSLTHMTARRLGSEVTFSPITDPAGVGNGVHVHMSFLDADGSPVTYDSNGPAGMSRTTQSFVAGVLAYLPQMLCLLAPSVISYARLTPHRWSAAYNNLGFRDREAAVRICPVMATDPSSIARQYNFEVRAMDAAGSPHLVLAALVHAGCQGIEDELAAPKPSEGDLSELSAGALADLGYVRLPQSLAEALTAFEADPVVRGWFPDAFESVYLSHKRAEIEYVESMSETDRYSAYSKIY
ncbi:glutamine synthetase family protein [Notoacmeibacter marinus]|uniref:glutamine synthetase family protein n=1 Tax=Notoacmeibacter marinus TaxID=1876515 RepID=UPI000DF2CE16|nr:glutamine synthetase family protein [Notoacmeibacter marinus]